MESKQLKVVMYPWLAMGHIIPYYQLGLKLAERGHKVTLILPKKAILKLPFSSSLVTLHTITIPHINPLPLDTQLTSDIPFHLETHLATAFDRTQPEFESILASSQPNIIFYDFAYWIPEVVKTSGSRAKCVNYMTSSPTPIAIGIMKGANCASRYPSLMIEGLNIDYSELVMPYGEGITFQERIQRTVNGSNAIAVKTCRELEGKYCDFLSEFLNKPILAPGAVHTEPNESTELGTVWSEWLSHFSPGSVVFCSLGSQVVLEKPQFQEILLGFEMTNLPFLVALKPPTGCTTVEEAFPEGYKERIKERGMVTKEWVPQQQIVEHTSVGCFVNHCGCGSLWEALLSKNQIVLMPQIEEQVVFAKYITQKLKLGVEVERGEDGKWVSKESLCKAIKSVMDENNEIGMLVKKNHEIYREKLGKPGFMNEYVDNFIKDLQALLE